MDDRETLHFLRKVVYDHSGIHLTHKEEGLLVSRVARRVRELHLPSARHYGELLRSPQGRSEIPSLIDAVTINYTFFFREQAQFHALAAQVFPRLLAERAGGERGTLRIWSAGCSSGEEPYSIAVTLAEVVGNPERCDARILATDINRRVIRVGSRGVYPEDRFVHMPREYHHKYLVRDGATPPGFFRLCDEIRALVAFRRYNILRDAAPLRGTLDVIFCRNVMIYFDPPTKARLLSSFLRYLSPGGYLFIGESEKLDGGGVGFEPAGPSIFRKACGQGWASR
mgnify:CR=1 FL=1